MMDRDEPDIDDLLDRAASLEEQGSLLAAMQLLRRALEVRKDPVVLTRIGSLAMDLGQWREGEEALLAAIALNSDDTNPHLFLGLLYRAQNRMEAALGRLEEAARLEPSAVTFTILGVTQADLDLSKEARESYRRAISIDPSHLEAYYNLAVSLRFDQKEEAIELLQKALDINATYALAHRELGWLFRRTAQFPEAEYHLRRAIELDASDGWAYIYLGNLMWVTEDLASAEKAFSKAVEVWPGQSIAYWSFAHFRQHQGLHQEATRLFNQALEIAPGDAQANFRFGTYLRDIGEVDQAKQYLGWAQELDQDDTRAKAELSLLKARGTDSQVE